MAFEITRAGSRRRRVPSSALSTFPPARNLLTWADPVTLLRTVHRPAVLRRGRRRMHPTLEPGRPDRSQQPEIRRLTER